MNLLKISLYLTLITMLSFSAHTSQNLSPKSWIDKKTDLKVLIEPLYNYLNYKLKIRTPGNIEPLMLNPENPEEWSKSLIYTLLKVPRSIPIKFKSSQINQFELSFDYNKKSYYLSINYQYQSKRKGNGFDIAISSLDQSHQLLENKEQITIIDNKLRDKLINIQNSFSGDISSTQKKLKEMLLEFDKKTFFKTLDSIFRENDFKIADPDFLWICLNFFINENAILLCDQIIIVVEEHLINQAIKFPASIPIKELKKYIKQNAFLMTSLFDYYYHSNQYTRGVDFYAIIKDDLFFKLNDDILKKSVFQLLLQMNELDLAKEIKNTVTSSFIQTSMQIQIFQRESPDQVNPYFNEFIESLNLDSFSKTNSQENLLRTVNQYIRTSLNLYQYENAYETITNFPPKLFELCSQNIYFCYEYLDLLAAYEKIDEGCAFYDLVVNHFEEEHQKINLMRKQHNLYETYFEQRRQFWYGRPKEIKGAVYKSIMNRKREFQKILDDLEKHPNSHRFETLKKKWSKDSALNIENKSTSSNQIMIKALRYDGQIFTMDQKAYDHIIEQHSKKQDDILFEDYEGFSSIFYNLDHQLILSILQKALIHAQSFHAVSKSWQKLYYVHHLSVEMEKLTEISSIALIVENSKLITAYPLTGKKMKMVKKGKFLPEQPLMTLSNLYQIKTTEQESIYFESELFDILQGKITPNVLEYYGFKDPYKVLEKLIKLNVIEINYDINFEYYKHDKQGLKTFLSNLPEQQKTHLKKLIDQSPPLIFSKFNCKHTEIREFLLSEIVRHMEYFYEDQRIGYKYYYYNIPQQYKKYFKGGIGSVYLSTLNGKLTNLSNFQPFDKNTMMKIFEMLIKVSGLPNKTNIEELLLDYYLIESTRGSKNETTYDIYLKSNDTKINVSGFILDNDGNLCFNSYKLIEKDGLLLKEYANPFFDTPHLLIHGIKKELKQLLKLIDPRVWDYVKRYFYDRSQNKDIEKYYYNYSFDDYKQTGNQVCDHYNIPQELRHNFIMICAYISNPPWVEVNNNVFLNMLKKLDQQAHERRTKLFQDILNKINSDTIPLNEKIELFFQTIVPTLFLARNIKEENRPLTNLSKEIADSLSRQSDDPNNSFFSIISKKHQPRNIQEINQILKKNNYLINQVNSTLSFCKITGKRTIKLNDGEHSGYLLKNISSRDIDQLNLNLPKIKLTQNIIIHEENVKEKTQNFINQFIDQTKSDNLIDIKKAFLFKSLEITSNDIKINDLNRKVLLIFDKADFIDQAERLNLKRYDIDNLDPKDEKYLCYLKKIHENPYFFLIDSIPLISYNEKYLNNLNDDEYINYIFMKNLINHIFKNDQQFYNQGRTVNEILSILFHMTKEKHQNVAKELYSIKIDEINTKTVHSQFEMGENTSNFVKIYAGQYKYQIPFENFEVTELQVVDSNTPPYYSNVSYPHKDFNPRNKTSRSS